MKMETEKRSGKDMSISNSTQLERTASEKERKLIDWFHQFGSAIVAYSGGVDSTYVLHVAHKGFGSRAVAISSFSETVAQIQKDYALENIKIIGADYEIVQTREMEKEAFLRNNSDRCFHCKDELYGMLRQMAQARGFDVIVDGTN